MSSKTKPVAQNFAPDSAEVAAIIAGHHGAPMNILGPHVISNGDTSALVIRVFRPFDAAVFIREVDSGARHAMTSIHPTGFYQAVFEERAEPFAYRLIVQGRDGSEHELEDPYRFRDAFVTDYERHLHGEGRFLRSYEKFGAHLRTVDGVGGVNFAVWAPNAERVSVIGPFNSWDDRVHPMQSYDGIWEIFIPNLPEGMDYKYSVKSRYLNYKADKTDPHGFYAQMRPETGSVIWNVDKYQWGDDDWMGKRAERQALDQPINIYEVHLGSWKRVPETNGFLNYRDLAHDLADYAKRMGYTHIELLPITEHPFDGSWGYQTTGYFAPTSRHGTPDDFMYFVDHCHQHNIGVILDWVPAHFPRDAHGLGFFDGTHLYEHEDPRQGEHRDWGTKIFNFGRNEVRNFLLASAIFWLKKYHLDGLRVDAVASMLYLDYSREAGDWIPNKYGGRENLEAIEFIRIFNDVSHEYAPGILTIAEESTSWPMVSRPTYTGGLGFDLKWNMGWMHDTLKYFEKDPLFRRYHHNMISFSLVYAFSENFVLPFSHDEVVHLKKSLLDKMPGDQWRKFAGLRSLYGFMTGHPGKKLLFMGGEFGQWREWTEAYSLDWHLLQQKMHQQLHQYVADLNHLYLSEAAFHEIDTSWEGFAWLDLQDVDNSILSFQRMASDPEEFIVVVCNFTPVPHFGYRVGLPQGGRYTEIFNSDWAQYGGSNVRNPEEIHAENIPWQSGSCSAMLNLPPLGVIYLKPQR
ncbi:MAG: 1,4-alpha-glucan branching protein GlgB [Caldilineaceae bacterium]|nr:1,4-alpha-glucan branching protein GlgB [Caldilineaceae bacterium]